jgi:hypothetical protein
MKKMRSVGVFMAALVFVLLAAAVEANGEPGKTLPLPIPTGKTGLLILSNGMEQLFLHVMFENIQVKDYLE